MHKNKVVNNLTKNKDGQHNKTSFINHTPTGLYPQTNVYLRKFWPEIPKISQVQICCQVQDCWRVVHKTSCIMRCNGEMAGKTTPTKCKKQFTKSVVDKISSSQNQLYCPRWGNY